MGGEKEGKVVGLWLLVGSAAAAVCVTPPPIYFENFGSLEVVVGFEIFEKNFENFENLKFG